MRTSRAPWKDAERLITLVEAQHRRSIKIPRTPWLLFLSIGTLLLGIGLLAFNLQIILAFFQKDVIDQVLRYARQFLPGDGCAHRYWA